jgi:two-component sensor histidine kinase
MLVVEDDGVGRSDGRVKGTGLGTRIVKAMGVSIGAEISYPSREAGTSVMLSFAVPS